MPQFQYKAKNAQGKAITGVVNAHNETEAVAELRRQGLIILGLNAKKGGSRGSKRSGSAGGGGFFSLSLGGGRNSIKVSKVRVKPNEMVIFPSLNQVDLVSL